MSSEETGEDVSFVVEWSTSDGETSGPLALLWTLIESYQVDIFSVSLSQITADFLDYVTGNQLDLDEASRFTAMAGNLIYYKSRELLPQAPVEDDNDQSGRLPPELVHQLLEYKKFQLASGEFRSLEEESRLYLPRKAKHEFGTVETEWTTTIAGLVQAFASLLSEQEKKERVVELEYDEVSVSDKMQFIETELETRGRLEFLQLFSGPEPSRMEIVATFLAVLEMTKRRQINIRQDGLFKDLYIEKAEEQAA